MSNQRNRFEAQLQAVKERLEAAKVSAARSLPTSSPSGTLGGSIFGGAAARIAKPLRGGGGMDGGLSGPILSGAASIPILSSLQNQESPTPSPAGGGGSGGGKRGSWFFQNR